MSKAGEVSIGFLKNWRVFLALLLAVALGYLLFCFEAEHVIGEKNCNVDKSPPGKFKLLYTGLIMMVLFVLCFPHMGVVGFIPLAIIPLLSVSQTKAVAHHYMPEINMEFFATTLMGIALGCTQLQTRFVYIIMSLGGLNFEKILVIIMWTSCILSAFITSSAATFIMIPVAVLIKDEITNILLPTADTLQRQVYYKRRFTKVQPTTYITGPELEEEGVLASVAVETKESVHSLPPEPAKEDGIGAINDPATLNPEKIPPTEEEKAAEGEPSGEEEPKPEQVQQEPPPAPKHLNPEDVEVLQKFEESVLLTIGKAANIGGILFPYSTIVASAVFSAKPILYNNTIYNGLKDSKLICDHTKMDCSANLTDFTHLQYQSAPYGGGGKTGLYDIQREFTLGHWVMYTLPIFIILLIVNTHLDLFLNFVRRCKLFLWFPCGNEGLHTEESQLTIRNGDPEISNSVRKRMREKYHDLGPLEFREGCLAVVIFVWAVLFFFRDPRFMWGWSVPLKSKKSEVLDSCVSILFFITFFGIPLSIKHTIFPPTDDKRFVCQPLFPWSSISKRIPWGIVLMVGGASAIVGLSNSTLFNDSVARAFANTFHNVPHEIVLLFTLITISFCCQLFGNILIVGVAVPILISSSCLMNMHPLYLTVPVTVTCILSFVFPVSSIPNAILYHEGRVSWARMVKMGWVLNVVSVIVVYLIHISYAEAIFKFKSYPRHLPNNLMCPLSKGLQPFGCHKLR